MANGEIKRFRPSIYGVLCERGKVLVCESRFAKGRTFINFPGGGIEPGEDPAAALLREFDEETGLYVRPEHVLYASMAFHRSYDNTNRQLFGVYWRVQRLGGKLVLSGNKDDVIRAFWATPRQLLNLPFTTFDREAIPEIVTQLRHAEAK